MYQGEIMIYAGAGLIIIDIFLFIIVTVLFNKKKKQIIRRIYGE